MWISVKVGDKGQRREPSRCPIARAIRPLVKRNFGVYVGAVDVKIVGYNEEYIANLGRPATSALAAFDSGRKMKPFDFKINIPKRFLVDG